MTTKRLGRPPKAEGEAFSHYVYVRLLASEDEKLAAIARAQGFPSNGGRSAAVRFAINKIHALLFPPTKGKK